jgi:hypothetical protein
MTDMPDTQIPKETMQKIIAIITSEFENDGYAGACCLLACLHTIAISNGISPQEAWKDFEAMFFSLYQKPSKEHMS